MKNEPIAFRDDITVKFDGGGVAFSLDTMHRQQCVAVWTDAPGESEQICGKASTATLHGRSTRTTISAAEIGGGVNGRSCIG